MNHLPIDLVLFDDARARRWEPFALTRPAGELLFGVLTIRERAERVFGAGCVAHVTGEHLSGFDEDGAAPVMPMGAIPNGRARLFLLSRFIPDWGRAYQWDAVAEGRIASEDGRTIGWFAPAGTAGPGSSFVDDPDRAQLPAVASIPGQTLERVWNLVSWNPDQTARDIGFLCSGRRQAELPTGAYRWGGHALIVDETASVEPGTGFDTTEGPIWIDRQSRVCASTRLAGPTYLGAHSVLLGGPVEAASLGPMCRVRGELAETVCAGYVNKQHEGHIGHAYLGRWVNLGAGTTNSDLKNNYGTIRVWTPDGEIDTGEIKLGSLVGDHVKTGIGLLLNTGTVIGAGCNLYGTDMPPTYIPPFSWGTGGGLTEYRLDKFVEVAERAMSRRGVELTTSMREQLGRSWRRGRASEES